jgi:hypothetical protein
MVTKDKYGHDVNTEKIYGIHWIMKDKETGRRIHFTQKRYKTQRRMLQALNDLRGNPRLNDYDNWIGWWCPYHVYYDLG